MSALHKVGENVEQPFYLQDLWLLYAQVWPSLCTFFVVVFQTKALILSVEVNHSQLTHDLMNIALIEGYSTVRLLIQFQMKKHGGGDLKRKLTNWWEIFERHGTQIENSQGQWIKFAITLAKWWSLEIGQNVRRTTIMRRTVRTMQTTKAFHRSRNIVKNGMYFMKILRYISEYKYILISFRIH